MAILPVDPHSTDPAVVKRAGDALKRGGIVALRTDTVYGLLASVNRPDALKRLNEILIARRGRLAPRWVAEQTRRLAKEGGTGRS